MIGSLRYWAERMFAPRYWPKASSGVVVTFDPTCARTLVGLTPRRTLANLTPARTVANTTPTRTLECLED